MLRFLLVLGCVLIASGCDSGGDSSVNPVLIGRACTETDQAYDFSKVSPVLVGGLEALEASLVYPEAEREAGVEGRVIVRFIVETTGLACSVEVVRAVSPGLDREALLAIQRARFTPGRQDNRPVPVRMSLPVRFSLP